MTGRLGRVRWGVRAVLTLGVAASVVANVLHARQNPISQVIAAWPPLALLLTVELISRVPVHRRSLAAVRLVATATIAGIAAWVSYWHMAGVAARYGEDPAAAHMLPLSVDGLVVVASVCLVEIAGRIRALDTTPAAAPAPVSGPPIVQVVQSESAEQPEQPHIGPPPREPMITVPARQRPPRATPQQLEAARAAYRQSVEKGSPLTGESLGAMFGYGERWGQFRIQEVRDNDPPEPPDQRELVSIGSGASSV